MTGICVIKFVSGENCIGKIVEDCEKHYMVEWLIGCNVQVPQNANTDNPGPVPAESQIVFYPPSFAKMQKCMVYKTAISFIGQPLNNVLQAYKKMLTDLEAKYGSLDNVDVITQ